MQNKFKILHIHSDNKFIHDIYRYENGSNANRLMLLMEKHIGIDEDIDIFNPIIVNPLDEQIEFIKSEIAKHDIVVFNGLTHFIAGIILSLPTNVKLVWRFFGYELYGKKKSLYFSSMTKSQFRWSFLAFKDRFRKFKPQEVRYRKAIERIDSFVGLCPEEYSFLSKEWNFLPKFTQISIHPGTNQILDLPAYKENVIILGNSRSAYNNHLELLNIIKEREKMEWGFKVILPFSYGSKNRYSSKVLKEAKHLEVEVLENFIPKNEYRSMFQMAGAFIHNAKRQMAFGNIIFSFENGVKVYLNNQNSIFQWLKREGFEIFDINTFRSDLDNNNIILSKELAHKNLSCLSHLRKKYSKKKFQDDLWRSLF